MLCLEVVNMCFFLRTVAIGESITCEPGSMAYMSPGLMPDVDVGGCDQGCKRCCCAGESMFLALAWWSTKRLLVVDFPSKEALLFCCFSQ